MTKEKKKDVKDPTFIFVLANNNQVTSKGKGKKPTQCQKRSPARGEGDFGRRGGRLSPQVSTTRVKAASEAAPPWWDYRTGGGGG